MPIVVKCGSCQACLRVAEACAGKRVRCPRCKAVIGVSGDDQAKTVVEDRAGKAATISARPVKSDLMSTILGGFDGEFPPVARRIGYRLGLILVTMAMVVLPLLYLGLVAGVIYLLYWHATANLGPLKSTHSFRAIVFLYAGP